MLRRLGIRAKVMAVLAVPMIVLLAAGGFISWNAIQELRYAKAADSVITTLQAYTPVSERAADRSGSLTLNGASAEEIAAARAATDAALAAVRPITAKLDLSQFPQAVVDKFVEVQLAHNTMLPSVRTSVDSDSQRVVVEQQLRRDHQRPAQLSWSRSPTASRTATWRSTSPRTARSAPPRTTWSSR